jgi:hypothetical protein
VPYPLPAASDAAPVPQILNLEPTADAAAQVEDLAADPASPVHRRQSPEQHLLDQACSTAQVATEHTPRFGPACTASNVEPRARVVPLRLGGLETPPSESAGRARGASPASEHAPLSVTAASEPPAASGTAPSLGRQPLAPLQSASVRACVVPPADVGGSAVSMSAAFSLSGTSDVSGAQCTASIAQTVSAQISISEVHDTSAYQIPGSHTSHAAVVGPSLAAYLGHEGTTFSGGKSVAAKSAAAADASIRGQQQALAALPVDGFQNGQCHNAQRKPGCAHGGTAQQQEHFLPAANADKENAGPAAHARRGRPTAKPVSFTQIRIQDLLHAPAASGQPAACQHAAVQVGQGALAGAEGNQRQSRQTQRASALCEVPGNARPVVACTLRQQCEARVQAGARTSNTLHTAPSAFRPDAPQQPCRAANAPRPRTSSLTSTRSNASATRAAAAWRPACCADNNSGMSQRATPVLRGRSASAGSRRDARLPDSAFSHFEECLPQACSHARVAQMRSADANESEQGCPSLARSTARSASLQRGSRGDLAAEPHRCSAKQPAGSLTQQAPRQAGMQSAHQHGQVDRIGSLHQHSHGVGQQSARDCNVWPGSMVFRAGPKQQAACLTEQHAGAQGRQGRRRSSIAMGGIASLPSYGDRLRLQAREGAPHGHDRLFCGFQAWTEVSYFTLQVRNLIGSWLARLQRSLAAAHQLCWPTVPMQSVEHGALVRLLCSHA